MKEIPFCQPWFRPEYADIVHSQVLSGWVGPGPVTSEFASAIADYVGSPHCLLTTSGTVALMVSARALKLQPGDEILVPAYGVVSTINAFASMGLSCRLVDIDRVTGCMSIDSLAAKAGPNTKAVCFVNFSGYTGSNLIEITDFCKTKNLLQMEDAACAFGQTFQGRHAGTFAKIGIYSFSVPKIITTGQGGAIVTNSLECYNDALRFIDQGDENWRKTNLIRGIGTNLRYNDILASFGLAQLKDIKLRLELKRIVYEVLRGLLGKKLFYVQGGSPSLYNIIFTKEREKLLSLLNARGIRAVSQYRTLCEHPPYAQLREGEYPDADFWTQHAVYLPFGLALNQEDAEFIATTILESGIPLLDIDLR